MTCVVTPVLTGSMFSGSVTKCCFTFCNMAVDTFKVFTHPWECEGCGATMAAHTRGYDYQMAARINGLMTEKIHLKQLHNL